MSNLLITKPAFTIGGRTLKDIGLSAINVTNVGGIRADIIPTESGSISKISSIPETFELTIPIGAGTADDSFMQDMFNSKSAYKMTGSVTQKIISADGNDKLETYDIYGFVIQNSPDSSSSVGIVDIEAEAYRMYKVKFVGKRVV